MLQRMITRSMARAHPELFQYQQLQSVLCETPKGVEEIEKVNFLQQNYGAGLERIRKEQEEENIRRFGDPFGRSVWFNDLSYELYQQTPPAVWPNLSPQPGPGIPVGAEEPLQGHGAGVSDSSSDSGEETRDTDEEGTNSSPTGNQGHNWSRADSSFTDRQPEPEQFAVSPSESGASEEANSPGSNQGTPGNNRVGPGNPIIRQARLPLPAPEPGPMQMVPFRQGMPGYQGTREEQQLTLPQMPSGEIGPGSGSIPGIERIYHPVGPAVALSGSDLPSYGALTAGPAPRIPGMEGAAAAPSPPQGGFTGLARGNLLLPQPPQGALTTGILPTLQMGQLPQPQRDSRLTPWDRIFGARHSMHRPRNRTQVAVAPPQFIVPQTGLLPEGAFLPAPGIVPPPDLQSWRTENVPHTDEMEISPAPRIQEPSSIPGPTSTQGPPGPYGYSDGTRMGGSTGGRPQPNPDSTGNTGAGGTAPPQEAAEQTTTGSSGASSHNSARPTLAEYHEQQARIVQKVAKYLEIYRAAGSREARQEALVSIYNDIIDFPLPLDLETSKFPEAIYGREFLTIIERAKLDHLRRKYFNEQGEKFFTNRSGIEPSRHKQGIRFALRHAQREHKGVKRTRTKGDTPEGKGDYKEASHTDNHRSFYLAPDLETGFPGVTFSEWQFCQQHNLNPYQFVDDSYIEKVNKQNEEMDLDYLEPYRPSFSGSEE